MKIEIGKKYRPLHPKTTGGEKKPAAPFDFKNGDQSDT